jgi:hypothetical protein
MFFADFGCLGAHTYAGERLDTHTNVTTRADAGAQRYYGGGKLRAGLRGARTSEGGGRRQLLLE